MKGDSSTMWVRGVNPSNIEVSLWRVAIESYPNNHTNQFLIWWLSIVYLSNHTYGFLNLTMSQRQFEKSKERIKKFATWLSELVDLPFSGRSGRVVFAGPADTTRAPNIQFGYQTVYTSNLVQTGRPFPFDFALRFCSWYSNTTALWLWEHGVILTPHGMTKILEESIEEKRKNCFSPSRFITMDFLLIPKHRFLFFFFSFGNVCFGWLFDAVSHSWK